MRVSIIVAVSANGVIGRDNDLPWRLSADLRRFKRLTMGHHLIMGRRTWESVGKPLPGRTTVVITSRRCRPHPEVAVARSLDEALELIAGDDEVFIAGGAELYRAALPVADRLYLTRIHADFEGDTFFPQLDEAQWRLVSREDHAPDEKNALAYSFLVYERADGEEPPCLPPRLGSRSGS